MKSTKLIESLRSCGVNEECLIERFDDDPDFYAECFEEFLKEQSFADLDKALAAKEYKDAFSAAHSMKGLAANLSLRDVYSKLSELVEALRSGHYENLDAQHEAVMKELATLKSLSA